MYSSIKKTPEYKQGAIISINAQLRAIEIMHSLITHIEREVSNLGVVEKTYIRILDSASDRYAKSIKFCKCL